MLARNLANDIINGKREVRGARDFYATTAMTFKQGKSQPYTERLQFPVRHGGTEDPDRPATPSMASTGQKRIAKQYHSIFLPTSTLEATAARTSVSSIKSSSRHIESHNAGERRSYHANAQKLSWANVGNRCRLLHPCWPICRACWICRICLRNDQRSHREFGHPIQPG